MISIALDQHYTYRDGARAPIDGLGEEDYDKLEELVRVYEDVHSMGFRKVIDPWDHNRAVCDIARRYYEVLSKALIG